MHEDPRRERQFDSTASRPVAVAMPDGAAFGLMAGGLMLGTVMAQAEHQPPVNQRPNADTAVPATTDPPKGEAIPPHDPLTAGNMHPGIAIIDPATPSQLLHDAPHESLRHEVPESDRLPQSAFGETSANAFATSSRATETLGAAGSSQGGESFDVAGAALPGTTQLAESIVAPLAPALENLAETLNLDLSHLAPQLSGALDAAVDTIEATAAHAAETLSSATKLLDALPSSLLGDTSAVSQATGILASAFEAAPTLDTGLNVSHAANAAATELAAACVSPVQSAVSSLHDAVDIGGAIHLGFLGQSYMDAVDPHDTAFHTLNSPLHGLV